MTVEDAIANVKAVQSDSDPAESVADPKVKTESGTTPQVTYDDNYSKLMKIIPAPIAGGYVAAMGIMLTATDTSDGAHDFLTWGLFALFLVGTIAFLAVRGVARFSQLLLSGVAFAAIATVTPGPFTELSGWDTAYGAVAVIVAGVALAIFQPDPLPQAGQAGGGAPRPANP